MKGRFQLYDHLGRSSPVADHFPAIRDGLMTAWQLLEKRDLLKTADLSERTALDLNFVSDDLIAELHAQYLADPSPTDVMTFPPSEIFVSYDTALRESTDRALPLGEELYRYCLHGFLHLAGYNDQTEKDFLEMHTLQEQLIVETYGSEIA